MPEIDFDFFADVRQRIGGQGFQSVTRIPLMDVAAVYSIESLIRGFLVSRNGLTALLDGLDDTQVKYQPAPGEFSIGEVVSHMVAAQGGIYNALLDLSGIVMPFVAHAEGGPGGGARNTLGADALRANLREATDEIVDLMRQIARVEEPTIREYPVFGKMSPKSWIMFQIYHDYDHVAQAKAVRDSVGFPVTAIVSDSQKVVDAIDSTQPESASG